MYMCELQQRDRCIMYMCELQQRDRFIMYMCELQQREMGWISPSKLVKL